jgi:pyruvate-formate lyase-activating enzyme
VSQPHELRQWVRLTRTCNNRCEFCLDSSSQDGGHVPRAEVEARIHAGPGQGATRLILSGGEPTLHPDYLDFIRLGRRMGYRWIQTVTNGRRFAYPKFLRACLDAGLDEITFSLHGHTAALHDELVGVPGAFDQSTAGLLAALGDGRPVVNVDVCVNRKNVAHLPAILDHFIGLGVREFDLLHLVPFGRAFELRSELIYDLTEAQPTLEHAFDLAARPDLHIWFNRFPPEVFEGHEALIQDGEKLLYEVRGRSDELARGLPLACAHPDRCPRCVLHGLCAALARQDFDALRMDLRRPFVLPERRFETVWLRGASLDRAPDLPGDQIILELDSYADLSDRVLGKRILRAYASRAEDLDRLLSAPAQFEVVALLDRSMVAHLEARYPEGHPRLAFAGRTFAPPVTFFARYSDPVVEGLPTCVTGRAPRVPPRCLDASWGDASGAMDFECFTRDFIRDEYLVKSRRCAACSETERCPGIHLEIVRAQGFGVLVPNHGAFLAHRRPTLP